MYNIRKIWDILNYKSQNEEHIIGDRYTKIFTLFFISLVCAFVAFINRNTEKAFFMNIGSVIMSITFAVCGFIYVKYNKWFLVTVIISVIIDIAFSLAIIYGTNKGVAMLWISLVPLIGMFGLGFKVGFFSSIYYAIFLIIVFYSPVQNIIPGRLIYTDTFMMRFPIQYSAELILSCYIYYKRIYYQKTAEYNAVTDIHTGLGNRRYYNESSAALSKNPPNADVHFFVFDANELKIINDNYGHAAGDELILGAAECLKKSFTDAEILARVGGDEFYAVVIGDINIAERLNNFSNTVNNWSGQKIASLSISCGYATREKTAPLAMHELEKSADMKMYKNKEDYYKSLGNDRQKIYKLHYKSL